MDASGMVGRGYGRIGPDYKSGLRLLSALTGLVALTGLAALTGWRDYPTHSRRVRDGKATPGTHRTHEQRGHLRGRGYRTGAAGSRRSRARSRPRPRSESHRRGAPLRRRRAAAQTVDAENPGDVFLGCKTIERTRETAAAELG